MMTWMVKRTSRQDAATVASRRVLGVGLPHRPKLIGPAEVFFDGTATF